ncbi:CONSTITUTIVE PHOTOMORPHOGENIC protein [Salix suchowensis]|nr:CONSTITUTIVE PHOTOMORPHOGENIC protein [Salix suchowensis]
MTYLALAKVLSTLSWKAVKTEHVLVNDIAANPIINAVQLIVVSQVSHRTSYLGPVGNFNVQFDNMIKAKLSFDLKLPADPAFTFDYYRAMSALKRIQKEAVKTADTRNLFIDTMMNSDNPDYFPTSNNWPVPTNTSQAFLHMMESHIFQPLHVFTSTGKRVNSLQFTCRLPGALVKVHFTLHHWHFAKERFDSFNTHPKQIIIIKKAIVKLDKPGRSQCMEL